MGFLFWIHGEEQPLPEERSLWLPAGRSGLRWGAGGLQRREEGDVSLCCSAARSQMGGTAGSTCWPPVFSTIPAPWGLWISSVDGPPPYLSLLDVESWLKSIKLQEMVPYGSSVLPFYDVMGSAKNPIHFQVKEMSSLVSKGENPLCGKESQRWTLVEFLALFSFSSFFFYLFFFFFFYRD